MFGQLSLDIIALLMLYTAGTTVAATACIYLLLRRGNAFAPRIRTPRRLRRWTAVFFGAVALGHLWYLPSIMFTSGDAESHFTTKMAVMVLVSFVKVMLTLPLVYVNMKYLNEDNVSYWKSFIANYKTGAKYIGMIFITLLLTAIISLLVTSVIQLPFYVLMMALGTSQFGVLYGDPAGLPASFPLLVFFTLLIVMLVSCILTVFEMLVMYFLYGSIEQKQRERQEVSKVFEATVATTKMPDIISQ